MLEKVVVIGSNSFSGASFIAYALQQNCSVIGLSRSSELNQVFLPYQWIPEVKNYQFHQLDLNHDLDRIIEVIQREKPDYVINFAAQSMVAQSWDYPEHWFMTNVVSSVKFHEQLRKCDFLKKYVHISTPEVYGSVTGSISEETPYNPSTPYAVSKAAADMSLISFQKAYSFPVVFTRAANVYGPGQQLYRIIPRTVLFIRLNQKLQLHGGGVSERAFIHMRDVSDATLRIARNAPPGEIYHISTNRMISIRDLVQMTCDRMKVSFEDHVEVAEERQGKDAFYSLSSEKLRSQLGWLDQVSLEEGIEEIIQWVDSNLDILKTQEFNYQHKP
jgi:dTDP-glucose 4,6-dehydratase